LIVIAAQADGRGIGRIRMRVIQHPSAASLHPFIEDCIEPGSTVHIDGWQGYAGLKKKGYDHEVTPVRKRPREVSTLMPRVHLVVSLLKRWLAGTHEGGVSHEHLPYYLDEFTFRFNPAKIQEPGEAVLPSRATSRGHRPHDLRPHRQPITICRGYLSQVHTQLCGYRFASATQLPGADISCPREIRIHLDFPAFSPHILACGGARLQSADGAITSETVRNRDFFKLRSSPRPRSKTSANVGENSCCVPALLHHQHRARSVVENALGY